MPTDADEIQRLKRQLEHDLDIIRQYEEIRSRYPLNGIKDVIRRADVAYKDEDETVTIFEAKRGTNTGLGDKLIALVGNMGARGTSLAEIADSLTEMGYPHSNRHNLKASAYQALKRLVGQGKLRKENGRYFEGRKK